MPADGDLAQTVHAFQRLMDRFLDTQRDVMIGYLTGTARNGATAGPTRPATGVSDGPADDIAQRAVAEDTTAAEDTAAYHENSVLEHLRRLISERTGYPPELLSDDIDLEADLGIDSVKRVEVLGALQRAYQQGRATRIAEGMDTLRRTKTLRGLATAVSALLSVEDTRGGRPAQDAQHFARSQTSGQDEEVEKNTPRFLLGQVTLPRVTTRVPLPSDGVLLITDDGRGYASCLAALLHRHGTHALVVGWTSGGRDGPAPPGMTAGTA